MTGQPRKRWATADLTCASTSRSPGRISTLIGIEAEVGVRKAGMRHRALRIFCVLAACFLSTTLSFHPANADSPVIFAPAQFVRGTGAPEEFTRTFGDCAPAARFKLVALNGNPDGTSRVSSAAIRINGKEILGLNDFSQPVGQLERSIALSRQNEIRISLSSKPGSVLTVSVECASNCPSGPLATPSGSDITFTTASCVIVSTISLKSQDVVDAQGNVTATRNQTKIADDASHVGVYTITFNISANDEAGTLVQTTFRYFNASGQLWQIDAPAGAGFVFPLTKSERHLTPDGSRVLLVSSTLGNTDPIVTVYDQDGRALYQLAGAFSAVVHARISPNGRYLLVKGVPKTNTASTDLIRVIEIETGRSSDFPFDVANGRPVIGISTDGRFVISFQGMQVTLP